MEVKPLDSDDLFEFCEWTSWYSKYGPYTTSANVRFGIGVYQLGQAIDWEGTESEWESYAAAAVHMLGAGAVAGWSLDDIFMIVYDHIRHLYDHKQIRDLSKPECEMKNWKSLMHMVARAQRNFHYWLTTSPDLDRASRYNKKQLQSDIGWLVWYCLLVIPSGKRKQAILDATTIMAGRL